MQLNEEVGRLRDVEMESFRKDAYIQTLQQLVNDLKTKFAEQQPLIMGQDVNLTQKICQLENEVTSKEQELNAVKEQVMGCYSKLYYSENQTEKIVKLRYLKLDGTVKKL